MSKIVIEDIKKDRRSLREVIPSRHASTTAPVAKRKTPATSDLVVKKHYHDDNHFTGSWISPSWLWGTVIIIGAVVLVGYFVAPIFTRVTVAITPKELTTEIDEKINAVRDTASGELAFTILPEIEKTVSVTVPATGDKHAEIKASGKIRITNNFSADPQQLVATTRFTSVKGKVYRIAQNITVPGVKAGKPGTVEVTVYADKPGSDYNDSLTSFTIPGLAGSPKFSKITAQSVSPMSGGFIGNIKVVSADTEASVRKQISDQLQKDLADLVEDQIPAGFFSSDDLISFNYAINQAENTQNSNTATFAGKGTVTAVIFNESNFTQKLISQAISSDTAKNPIKITNLDELDIKTASPLTSSDLSKLDTLALTVTGKANLLWQINQAKIVTELAGQPRDVFADIFKNYGESIAGGEVIFHPSWSKRFPTDQKRINIQLLTPNPPETP